MQEWIIQVSHAKRSLQILHSIKDYYESLLSPRRTKGNKKAFACSNPLQATKTVNLAILKKYRLIMKANILNLESCLQNNFISSFLSTLDSLLYFRAMHNFIILTLIFLSSLEYSALWCQKQLSFSNMIHLANHYQCNDFSLFDLMITHMKEFT